VIRFLPDGIVPSVGEMIRKRLRAKAAKLVEVNAGANR
jgi:hypothetical protein